MGYGEACALSCRKNTPNEREEKRKRKSTYLTRKCRAHWRPLMARAERSTACVWFSLPCSLSPCDTPWPEAPRAVCLATCVCTQIDHYALWVFSCLCPGSGTYGPGGCGRYWMLARHKITISFRKEKEPGYSKERHRPWPFSALSACRPCCRPGHQKRRPTARHQYGILR